MPDQVIAPTGHQRCIGVFSTAHCPPRVSRYANLASSWMWQDLPGRRSWNEGNPDAPGLCIIAGDDGWLPPRPVFRPKPLGPLRLVLKTVHDVLISDRVSSAIKSYFGWQSPSPGIRKDQLLYLMSREELGPVALKRWAQEFYHPLAILSQPEVNIPVNSTRQISTEGRVRKKYMIPVHFTGGAKSVNSEISHWHSMSGRL
ncbi:hypothetical protein DFH07DRAFT_765433 [Mycena maculata]|uniref:Uncharacterized protein n=1 Tax=Mycena maculata TaxID=230809 RepID=A0AAD7K7T9_9AGAR|nr:hypothetical protein DFH07DRAFT_765433 [Mycena maculata]